MSVCRQHKTTTMDLDDIDGVLNLLSKAIVDFDEIPQDFYKGAYYSIFILRYHSHVDKAPDYMALLENYFREEYR